MTPGSPLADPGSRTFAGWWKQLASLSPQRLWFGHLRIQRTETLVRTTATVNATPFQRYLLQTIQRGSGGSCAQLDATLHVGERILQRSLDELLNLGLLRSDSIGWQLTTLGQQLLSEGAYQRPQYERRRFAMLDARPHLPAQFLHLPESCHLPDWPAPLDLMPIPIAQLQMWLQQSNEWKASHGFPRDVEAILDFQPEQPASNGELLQPAWRRVPLHSGERLTVAIAESAQRYFLYPIRQEGNGTIAAEPLLEFDAESPLATLLTEPTEQQWFEAWRKWCASRNIRADDTREVQRDGHWLRITVSHNMEEHLATHGGEQWLLADGPLLRASAQVVWHR